MTTHRFAETINGRAYIIEVLPVGQDRWRAHVARAAGAPTAVMPFYGPTPDDAARQLASWLIRVSRPAVGVGENLELRPLPKTGPAPRI